MSRSYKKNPVWKKRDKVSHKQAKRRFRRNHETANGSFYKKVGQLYGIYKVNSFYTYKNFLEEKERHSKIGNYNHFYKKFADDMTYKKWLKLYFVK